MPTATPPTISEDEIDDLLYLSRIGETSDLKTSIEVLARNLSTNSSTILAATVDPSSGNGLLHMASANGHTETLKELLTLSTTTHALSLDLPNTSGNTPLHWAALNGHLDAVKVLVGKGADVTVLNGAGHDAVYAAEIYGRNQVAEWLLQCGKGLERGFRGGREVEERDEAEIDVEVNEGEEAVKGEKEKEP